jgi:hypothetical protein
MTIDLSHYVNKEVKVVLKNGSTYIGRFSPWADRYRFYFDVCNLSYSGNGTNYWKIYQYDIAKIELVTLEPKQNILNALEPKTLDAIASALTPEAIKYIESHEKYAEVMQALIIEFVEKNVGDVNGELPFMIFDSMFLARGRN